MRLLVLHRLLLCEGFLEEPLGDAGEQLVGFHLFAKGLLQEPRDVAPGTGYRVSPERREELIVIAHELRDLNESLQAITDAALGTQGPQVRRRRTG